MNVKRQLRLLMYFLLGFVLGGYLVVANAETQPAANVVHGWNWSITMYGHGSTSGYAATAEAACSSIQGFANVYQYYGPLHVWQDTSTGTFQDQIAKFCVWGEYPTGQGGGVGSMVADYSLGCPAGWTFDGQHTCTKDNPCQAGVHSTASRYTGSFATSVPGKSTPGTIPLPSTLCNGTCTGTVGTPTSCNADSVAPGQAVSCTYDIVLTGDTCTGGNGTAPVDPTLNAPVPPCNPGDGAISSNTTGNVKCVPATTPGATVPPVVSKKSSVETKPDGSTITSTVTTTCTGDGACSSSTTIINNNGPSCTANCQAGPPGTTQKQADKPAQDQSDFCAQNPTLQMCKGGMNEEVTQKKVLEDLEKFHNPSWTDDSALTSKTFEASQALKDHDSTLQDASSGGVEPGAVTASKSAWSDAMSSGWFSPVTLTTCSPIVSNFAGKTWTLNHCPIAEKISEIGSYAMWFMLLVSTFVMLTGGKVGE